MSAAYLFLDTNVFLHYPAFEIDWLEIAGCGEATLVVAPVVVRELDKHKETGRTGLRNRAGTVLQQLSRHLEKGAEAEVRRRTRLVFLEHEGLIDFREHKLDKDIADDQLIASIVAFRQDHPDARVALVSAELKFLVKARVHDIQVIRPPKDRKLPPFESDPAKKRVRELEQELAVLKNRIPKLQLEFQGGGGFQEFRVPRLVPISEEEIARRLETIKRRHPQVGDPSMLRHAEQFTTSLIVGSRDPISRAISYNAEITGFWKDYENYLRRLSKYQERDPVAIDLELKFTNAGTAPAENTDVFLDFEIDETVLVTKSGWIPRPPKPPDPLPPFDSYYPPLGPMGPLAQSLPGYLPQELPNVTGPDFSNGAEVRYHIRSLKQHMTITLRGIGIEMPKMKKRKGFGIAYTINSASVPDAITGRLDVRIVRIEASESEEGDC